uniref:Purple acid phosphatase n=1 Tax=Bursaphelenchus xylophilus TaxID=6326 RepID=A0A1I7RSK0_BURXY
MVVLILFVTSLVTAQRVYLEPGRRASWETDNPNDGPDYVQPEQVHLSLGDNSAEYTVTWITFSDTKSSYVEWSEVSNTKRLTAEAKISNFSEAGVDRFIHRAILKPINSGVKYEYRVGSEYGISPKFTFTGLKERPEGGYKYAVYGDLGNRNGRSLGRLQRGAQDGLYDVVLHVGDMAYDLDTEKGNFGDEFLRQIEPIAAYVPYQVVPGNHEQEGNFSHYKNRFTMPRSEHNLWYSFDLGPTHFIGFSSEVYYFWPTLGKSMMQTQWNWIVDDLKKANENRKNVPWIITMAHRPMYCSTLDDDDCTHIESRVRKGDPETHEYGLEKLFFDQGVDVSFWAHEHTYERLWPVYDRIVYNGTKSPYLEPPAPVHLLSGSAGCQENTDQFDKPGVWDAFRSSNYGFGLMHIYNSSHINFKQINATNGLIEDEIWVIKEKHGPYDKADVKKLKKFGTYVPYNTKNPRTEI